jgi:hypothetical protein
VAFALHPFGSDADRFGLTLGGQVAKRGDRLSIHYRLIGDLASVLIPVPDPGGPRRCDGLWEHTCFELFLAAEGAEAYWEVNLAPNGHWNLYRLAGYRQGLAPLRDRDALPFQVRAGDGEMELTLNLLLPEELSLASRAGGLRLGVSAVVEQRGGALSYWALAHGGSEADFHRREDFRLRLWP